MAHCWRIGAFATIQDGQGRVLLCHRRDHDFWNQPSGGVEAGETPWQAMLREAREETGLEVAVERLAGVYCWPDHDEIIFSFVCRAVGGALTTNDEARAVAWFNPDMLPPNTFPEHAERIRDALAGKSEPCLTLPSSPSIHETLRRARMQK